MIDGPPVHVDVHGASAALAQARRVLLTCHLGPDGDSLGSMAALAALLGAHGALGILYNPDPAPRHLRFLPHVPHMLRSVDPNARFDLTVVVDCGDRKLVGERFPAPAVTGPVLVLDHHATSRPFGDLYWLDVSAASVGVLVARLADALGWPLTDDAATAIYVSLVSDTGSFRYANANAEAFQLAARLVADHGVEPWGVAQRLGEEVPLARYKLLSAVLAGLELVHGGRAALMTVTEEMVRGAGARWEHTEGLVSYARALEGVEAGLLLSPAATGGTRVSLRTKGRLDAGAVCARFGGGGHRGAAGCIVPQPLVAARPLFLEVLGEALAQAFAPAPTPGTPTPTSPAGTPTPTGTGTGSGDGAQAA